MIVWGFLFLLLFVFLSSLAMTGFIRRYSLRHKVLDIPNERSSHTLPTPRGGGLSIAIWFVLAILAIYWFDLLPAGQVLALAGGGLLVGLIGWLDDHYNIAAVWRAGGYLFAAAWAVYWLGGMPELHVGHYAIELSSVGAVLAVLAIAWLTNLYNFMDGTDALAGIESLSVSAFAAVLFYLGDQQGPALLCAILFAATAGFLYWNLPPARVFMGDAGSCVIGFGFGTLALIGEQTGAMPIMLWIILLAIFIFDASFTLIMRMVRGERWYSAHRSHAYQRLVQMGMNHGQLAISVLFINLVFLWSLAWLVYVSPEAAVMVLSVLIVLMLVLWGNIQLRFGRHRQ